MGRGTYLGGNTIVRVWSKKKKLLWPEDNMWVSEYLRPVRDVIADFNDRSIEYRKHNIQHVFDRCLKDIDAINRYYHCSHSVSIIESECMIGLSEDQDGFDTAQDTANSSKRKTVNKVSHTQSKIGSTSQRPQTRMMQPSSPQPKVSEYQKKLVDDLYKQSKVCKTKIVGTKIIEIAGENKGRYCLIVYKNKLKPLLKNGPSVERFTLVVTMDMSSADNVDPVEKEVSIQVSINESNKIIFIDHGTFDTQQGNIRSSKRIRIVRYE